MAEVTRAAIEKIVGDFGKDRTRLMDIVRAVCDEAGCVSEDAIAIIADALGIHRVEVRDMVSFYAFLPREAKGESVVRLCNCVSNRLNGVSEVAKAFEAAAGCSFGEASADGKVALEYTPCIGMCDQAPAALVGDVVLTKLAAADAQKIIDTVRRGGQLHADPASGPLSQVDVNLRQHGEVIFAPLEKGAAIRAAVNVSPEDVIKEMNVSRVRGRGGAGFPLAMKWSFCRKAEGDAHYVVCNADEGEPGTFKDRVILTECPDLLFEGMTVAGYAVGATQGVLYLRGEYRYLKPRLEQVLAIRRRLGLLGEDICGRDGFDFDIRVQMGAGAYVCGEESALIESMEGKRGAPRDRPPFPVQKGYLNQPTSVNNVETLCCAARIMAKGGEWFSKIGTKDSTGTKVLSVSGDCAKPGVYEIPYGITVKSLIDLVGAENTQAVQVGGPSGECVAPKDFGRQISFEDLPTGGSIIIFNKERDLLEYMREFIEFFVEESCGWCAPCRVGTTAVKHLLDKILEGRAGKADLAKLESLGATMKTMSRCGLGQTASNPVMTTIRNFRHLYENRLLDTDFAPLLDMKAAQATACAITGQTPHLED